ncbi:hypothetical protein OX283_012275 [Flavobacterium sp. SUN052]|uniref:hypothetical protein n=1 Tax=Flavobacterium sp. SUN052 TaxID=3002441 RepID=UPI00237DEDED|nr:hypothetical protein [Flavobacterium sp. SUN052]MEC4005437.1 hypothetical protein [Flavobacterium sp. SUN052]
MRKIIILMLLTTYCSFGQKSNKVEDYNYGKNGIEYIVKNKNGTTVIISTFNSRPTIKDEVAVNVYNYFKEKSPIDGEKITIIANDAVVEGTYKIKIKGTLTSVEFHYESVEWKSGLTEVYKNPNPITPSTISIADSDE